VQAVVSASATAPDGEASPADTAEPEDEQPGAEPGGSRSTAHAVADKDDDEGETPSLAPVLSRCSCGHTLSCKRYNNPGICGKEAACMENTD